MYKSRYYIILTILFLSASSVLFSQNVGINTTGTTPSTNAILDLNTGNTLNKYGFVVPHVGISSTSTFGLAGGATIKDTGMFVYNMIVPSGNTQQQPAGLYFWDGNSWDLMSTTGGVLSSYPINNQWVNSNAMAAGLGTTKYYIFGGYIDQTSIGGTVSYSNATLTTALNSVTYAYAYQAGGLIATSNGTFSKAIIWFNATAKGVSNVTLTLYIYDFTPGNNVSTATAMPYNTTALGSNSVSVTATNTEYSLEVDGTSASTFSKGDILVPVYEINGTIALTSLTIIEDGNIEVEYQ